MSGIYSKIFCQKQSGGVGEQMKQEWQIVNSVGAGGVAYRVLLSAFGYV